MDLEVDPELVFGEEFCFPATATYYPTTYVPAGVNLPAELYDHQTIWRCGDQDFNHSGQQAEGTSCMYYVVPDYEVVHSPPGPYPFEPFVMADGRSVGAQEYLTNAAGSTYHQPVPTPCYDVFPSSTDWAPASTSQTLAYSDSLFLPGRQDQSVTVASKKGIPRNLYLQSASVSSKKLQDHTIVRKVQLHSSGPWKQELTAGSMVPSKLCVAPQVSQHSLHDGVPSVKHTGSDLRMMVLAEKFQPSPKPRSYVNTSSQKLRSLSRQGFGKGKMSIGSASSEIVVKSYTSRLHIDNPEGKIIIKTDQYNRADFEVVYPNAKFFVIKSCDEENVHKSIKYGVWSSTAYGNEKLDSAFRDAQVIAASSSTSCPVFLFFSVNRSSHFCGVAEMVGPVDFQKKMDFWSQDKWIGSFPVRWHIIKNVPNITLHWILLQNNEGLPVTFSRDTQEIHYAPGTCMLKIFKANRANECLFDDFTMYEEKEARSRKCMSSKLRRDAPRFIPVPKLYARRTYVARQPKADCSLKDRIIRETHDLANKLQHANLDRHQGSREEARNLIRDSAKAYAQKENYFYGKQDHENIAKAVTYQPLASNIPAALDGEQLNWKKIEVAPPEKEHPPFAAVVSSKAPEEYPNEDRNDLLHGAPATPEMICAPATPEMICGEQKIVGEHGSLAINSQTSEACSGCLVDDVMRIGSMLVPIGRL